LDELSAQILREVTALQDKHQNVDFSPVINLAREMQEKTAAVTKFFVDQVE
jgi:hypothetical protein